MPPSASTPAARHAARHRNQLRELFLQRLLTLQPRSVLDWGCGQGELLLALREYGIPAAGMERDPELVRRLQSDGLEVAEAEGEHLPLPDSSFGWVVLRHVLHHARHPARMLSEAWRVSRRGLLVAEPWHDSSIPAQELAQRVESFLRTEERKRGHIHHDNLGAGEILRLLPAPVPFSVQVETRVPVETRPPEWIVEEAQRVLGTDAEPIDAPTRETLAALLADQEKLGIGVAGTIILTVRKTDVAK